MNLLSTDTEPERAAHAAVRTYLDQAALDSLPPVALGLGLYHIIMALYNALVLPQPIATAMITLAVLSGLFAFILLVALQTTPLRPRHAHAVLATPLLLTLLNSMIHLYLTGEARQVSMVMLVMLLAGLLILSRRWMALILLASLGGSALVAGLALAPGEWAAVGLSTALAALVALVAHTQRRRSLSALARAQWQAEQKRAALQRCTAQMQANLTLGRYLTARQPLDTTLAQVVETLHQRYRATYVGILLLAEDGTELVARAGSGSAGRAAIKNGTRIPLGRGIIGWVAEHRRTLYVSDARRDARFVVWDLMPDTRSELTLPLVAYEQFCGVLDLQSDHVDAFHQDERSALQGLAGQIALSVQNATLYETDKRRQRLAETLYSVGRALARPLGQQAVLDLILQQVDTIIPHDRGAVLLQSGRDLHIVAAHGFPEHRTVFQWRIPIRPGDVFDEIRRTQRSLVLSDALRRADWYQIDDLLPARSWVGIPLVHDDAVVGMLSLARETHTPYTEDEVAYAASFAGQAMIALEAARLREAIKDGV